MATTHVSITRTILLSGLSAAAYFSAGVVVYYFVKKLRDRNGGSASAKRNSKKDGRRRKSKRSASCHSVKASSDCTVADSGGGDSDTGVSSCSSCGTSSSAGKQIDETSSKGVSRHSSSSKQEIVAEEVFLGKRTLSSGGSAFTSTSVDTSSAHTASCSTIKAALQQKDGPNDTIGIDSSMLAKCGENLDDTTPDGDDDSLSSTVLKERRISCDNEVSTTLACQDQGPIVFSTNKSVESPSVSSDGHSDASQDSGKGASTCLASVMSPIAEIDLPPLYEFEIPQDIVGLIIGRRGATIKCFTEESGAHIVIRHHFYSNKHKICTIEGTREQINKCLRLIRSKFPPSRFPELKLTPLLPPPVVSPHSPVLDSIISLSLPEGVKCDVVLSSIVDPGRFFVQQPTHPSFPNLARLDQYMLAVYSQPAGVPLLPRPIDIGIICTAPVLAGWYRAQTIAMFDETDEVWVKFVDYGGYSKISAMDLKQIRSDFMTLPFQAVECSLANVKPAGGEAEWSLEASEFLEKIVSGRVAEAVLLEKDADTGVAAVDLYCCIDDKLESINQLLVDLGYAESTLVALPAPADE